MNPINPLKHAMELDAQRYGYENAEEYMKEYGKVSLKAVKTAGEIILTAAGGEVLILGSKVGMVRSLRRVIWEGIKKVATKAWNTAKSAWNLVRVSTAKPLAQETIRKGVECVEAMIDGTPAPTTRAGHACFTLDMMHDKARENSSK